MNGLSTTFRVLRRRRADLGRFVLVLFALASASAGAAPCLAMTAQAAPGTQHSDSHTASMTADTAQQHSHGMQLQHEHSMPSADESGESHGPCAHCPPSVSMDGIGSPAQHAFCSASDDVSDAGKPNWSPPAFKHVLSMALVQFVPVGSRPSLASRQPAPQAAPPSVALNLRHCVFLI